MENFLDMEILKKIGKVLLYIIAGIVALLFIAGIFIDPIAKRLLEKQVSNAAEGQYSLEVDDLDISIIAGSVSLTGIRFTTDTVEADSPPYVFMGANKIAVEGVSWLTYLLDKRLQTDRIFLDSLDVELYARTVASQEDTSKSQKPFRLQQLDIYPAIKEQVDRVLLEDLGINDLQLTLINVTTQDTLGLKARELNFKSDNVLVDANKLITDNRAFYATRINFLGKELQVVRNGNLSFEAEAESLQFITKEDKMSVLGSGMVYLKDTLPQNDTLMFVSLQDFELRELDLNKVQEQNTAPLEKIGLTGLYVVNNMPVSNSSSTADTSQASSQKQLGALSLGESLPPMISRVELSELDINQVFVRQGDSIKVEDANFHATTIIIDENSAFAENRFLHAETMESEVELISATVGSDPILHMALQGFRMNMENGVGSLAFQELKVNPEKEPKGEMWFEAEVGPFKIAQIDTRNIMEGEVSIDSIGIMDPVVLVNMPETQATQTTSSKSSNSSPQQSFTPPSLYPAIEGMLDQLWLGKVAVIGGDFRIADIGGSDYGVRIPAFYLQMTDVLIAEGTAYAENRVLHAADIAVRMENISYPMPDSIYSAELDLFRLSTYEQFIEANDFLLTFREVDKQLLKDKNISQLIKLFNDDFRMDGINFQKLIQKEGIFVETIRSKGFEAGIYQNANAQAANADKKAASTDTTSTGMPQKMLNKLGMPLYIGSVAFESGYLTMEQLAAHPDSAQLMEITDVFLRGDNITNIPKRLKRDSEVLVSAGGKLMGTSNFETEAEIRMLSDSNLVLLSGTVDSLELTKLNRLVVQNSPIAISSGKIYTMEWNIKADEEDATGTLLMNYDNLEVALGGKDTTGLFKNIGSFLVNKLAVEEEADEDPTKPEKVEVSHERDKDKSFIDYYMATLVDGLKDILITIF